MHKPQCPELSIIVVSYNTRALTIACLNSVLAETKNTSFELLVVDNASIDGSAAAIARHPANPQLFALNENIGFARANNLAAKQARGRFILLLNPDTFVTNRAIDRLMDFATYRPEARIWGGRTRFADGTLNPTSCWKRMTLWNLACRACGLTAIFPNIEFFNGEAYGNWARDTPRKVDIVSGCFFLIEKKLWQSLGGFDPAFFMYGEEADLCHRARALPHPFTAQPEITPDATITHIGGASEATRKNKMIKLLQAKATLITRHWHPYLVPTGLWLNAAWPLSRWLALGAAHKFTRRKQHAAASKTWHEIWQARQDWQFGYDNASFPSTVDDHYVAAIPASTTNRMGTQA